MLRSTGEAVFIFTSLCVAAAWGQDSGESEPAREVAKQRMDLMRHRVLALKSLGPDDDQLSFSEEPALRYNDTPRGVLDASVWMLGQKGRPHAVLVIEIYRNGYAQYELTATANPPNQVLAPSWRWTPRQSDFTWKRIPNTPPPRNSTNLRRRQIKQLTQDFDASEEYGGQTYHLRLMPQPIHEYEDQERGILDGAVFVWAHGTNVEILMFIEARQEQGNPPHWEVGFSRLASASLDVTYRQQEFWNSPIKLGATQVDAYYFRGEPLTPAERNVFITE